MIVALVLAGGLAVTGPLADNARAAPTVASPSVVGSWDATGTLSVGDTLNWGLGPYSPYPTLATVVCAAYGTGITLYSSYNGLAMASAITNQRSNLYVGMFYLMFPMSGGPSSNTKVIVMLGAAGGQTNIQCTATAWTGVAGVDLSIRGANQDMSGSATSISLSPTTAVPANEVFFSAIHRYMPQGAPSLSVTGTGASASIVDSNTSMGSGTSYGCQAPGNNWEDCIGSAQVLAGGTSMTFKWANGGYALVAGFAIAPVAFQPGWDGDSVVYLSNTTNIGNVWNSGNAFFPKTQWGLAYQSASANCDGVANAINVTVGERVTTPSGTLTFADFWNQAHYNMEVDLPIATAVGGAGALAGSQQVESGLYAHQVTVNADRFSTYSNINIQPGYTQGINITGSNQAGNSRTDALFRLAVDAGSFLPGVGFAFGLYSTMQDFEGLSGVNDNHLGQPGPGTAYMWFSAINGTYYGARNVISAQTYAIVNIGQNGLSNYDVFTVGALSQIGEQKLFTSDCNGAAAGLPINSNPAVYLYGRVIVGSNPVAGATVNLQATQGFESGTIQEVKTDAGGYYRYFAQPGTSYTVSTTYGLYTNSVSIITNSAPNGQWVNLTIPPLSVSAYAGPTNTQTGVTVQFGTTLSGGYLFPINFSWDFKDGTSGWGSGPTHVYHASGTFPVTVKVVDSSNPIQTKTSPPVDITVTNPCNSASACISPASQTVYYGVCNFPTASFAGYAAPTQSPSFTYSWNFGDGKTGTGPTVSHTYPALAKTYTVTLTVTDGLGHTSTGTATVAVKYMGACAPTGG